MIDIIKYIFSTTYSQEEIFSNYMNYICIINHEKDFEYVLDLNYNYICTMKEMGHWMDDIYGGWDEEKEEYIIIFKNKI
jgi:hypothetical protein